MFLGRKHECDSTSGFCRDKCPYTNGSYPFWRVRNADNIPFLWTIRTIQMFDSVNARYPISKDPAKGYSSTYFGPGKKSFRKYLTIIFVIMAFFNVL